MKPTDGNLFETPGWLFRYLNERYHFTADLAATSENRKCPRFISPDENSLTHEWSSIEGTLWINPPYNPLKPWIEKAQTEARRGARIVALVPIKTLCNQYYQSYRADDVQIIVGRIPFEYRGIPIPGNQHNHCILTWDREIAVGTHGYLNLKDIPRGTA